MALCIENFKVVNDHPTVYYMPEFVTIEEEKYLIDNVNRAPKPKWTQLSNRRLQNWGGIPHPNGMIAEIIPSWLKKYTEKIGRMELFNGRIPNHVLVNEYLPGQGIMPHLDGPLFYPTISTINLGSHTVLNFYSPLETSHTTSASGWPDRMAFSLLLQPRSLLILQDKCYDYFLHGINETTDDKITPSVMNAGICGIPPGITLTRSTRISLTIRFVAKATKPLLRLSN